MEYSKLESKLKGKRTWKYEADSTASVKQYIFLHIPKTAGTTFRLILINHFEGKDIFPTQEELAANDGKYPTRKDFLKQKSYLGKAMLVGHFNINIVSKIKKRNQVKKLAFFRNPLDRILSHIKHIKSYNEEYTEANVNTILKENWRQIIFSQCIAMGYDFKNKNIKGVRKNIKELDFIGITAYFEESLQLCNATFNWELKNIPAENKIEMDIFRQLSPISKSQISKAIGPELMVYNIALNNFTKRCKKHNIQLRE